LDRSFDTRDLLASVIGQFRSERFQLALQSQKKSTLDMSIAELAPVDDAECNKSARIDRVPDWTALSMRSGLSHRAPLSLCTTSDVS
jgi:hypothetical protein